MSSNDDVDLGVDPAALLAGVLAVAVVPLIESGAWGWLNTAIAAVVALVLLSFYVASKRWHLLSTPEKISVFTVLWVVLTVLFAWPMQEYRTDPCYSNDDRVSEEMDALQVDLYTAIQICEDARGDVGTKSGAVAAIPATFLIAAGRFSLDKRRTHSVHQRG